MVIIDTWELISTTTTARSSQFPRSPAIDCNNMSRRAAIVEEFNDDTDLPLPSLPLPNTGSRGPLLQELHISDDEFEPSQYAGPASPPTRQTHLSESTSKPSENQRNVTDITPYKTSVLSSLPLRLFFLGNLNLKTKSLLFRWTCIYPIYLDAKRPYGPGQRRVERAKSLWWPLSKDIADAAGQLGLGTLHEVNKSHPRDWDNPGRVRVQWKKDGRLVNPIIKTS
jgi:signal recognition particle subunit SRP19